MSQAARLGDPIGHSPTMSWLVTGALVAGAIAGTAVAIVGTGGLAAVAIMGGALAGGAGIGEALSTMSFAPKEVCGTIVGLCSANVFTNGRPAARAHVDMTFCAKHPQVPLPIATGSASVFINGLPAARVDDTIACGAVITDGSGNVFIGGATAKTDVISPENLVPPAVHTAMMVVGVASAVILAGPVVAVVGLGLGMGGGMLGGFVGGKVFGEGSDGQKWSALGGSVIGGMLGGKIGTGIVNRAIPTPITPGMGFIKGGLPGMQAAEGAAAEAAAHAKAASAQAAAEAFTKPLPVVKAPAKVQRSVFEMRTAEAETAADNVAMMMEHLKISPDKSQVIQVLTHEDGTVSVGISGGVNVAKTQGRIDLLQDGLNKKFGEGKYNLGKTTLDEKNGIVREEFGNAPGVCAEPKAAAVAASNPSKITGGTTRWRGKGDNPYPENTSNSGASPTVRMAPCPTCANPANHMKYHNTAVAGKDIVIKN